MKLRVRKMLARGGIVCVALLIGLVFVPLGPSITQFRLVDAGGELQKNHSLFRRGSSDRFIVEDGKLYVAVRRTRKGLFSIIVYHESFEWTSEAIALLRTENKLEGLSSQIQE